MDDHMLERVETYGEYELVPRFQREYKEHGTMCKCHSYNEMKDFCKVLTLIRKWASPADNFCYKPSDFIDD